MEEDMKRDEELAITLNKHNKKTGHNTTFSVFLKNIVAVGYAVSQSVRNRILQVSDIMKDDVMAPYYVKFSNEDGIDTFFIMKKSRGFENDETIIAGEMFYTADKIQELKSKENLRDLYKDIIGVPCISIFEFPNRSLGQMTQKQRKTYLEKINKLTDMISFYLLYTHAENKDSFKESEKKYEKKITIFNRFDGSKKEKIFNKTYEKAVMDLENALEKGNGIVELREFLHIEKLGLSYLFISDKTFNNVELIVIGTLDKNRKPVELITGEVFHTHETLEKYKDGNPVLEKFYEGVDEFPLISISPKKNEEYNRLIQSDFQFDLTFENLVTIAGFYTLMRKEKNQLHP